MSTATLVVYRRRIAPRNQRWRWRLVAANGRNIANSGEGYSDRAVCSDMARGVVTGRYADTATIVVNKP